MSSEVEVSFKNPQVRSPHSKAYWDGLLNDRIVIQKCGDCGAFTHPPGPQCTTCLSSNRTHQALGERGTIYTYTVTHRAMHPEFRKDAPYIIVYVRMAEGITLASWLIGIDPKDVKIGMQVEAVFERIDERTRLHRFRPVAG
jgi:uncharacterized OB-fold protein